MNYECILCTNKFKNYLDILWLGCTHYYCTECVVKLVQKRSRKCPICRHKITWTVPMIKRHIDLTENIRVL